MVKNDWLIAFALLLMIGGIFWNIIIVKSEIAECVKAPIVYGVKHLRTDFPSGFSCECNPNNYTCYCNSYSSFWQSYLVDSEGYHPINIASNYKDYSTLEGIDKFYNG